MSSVVVPFAVGVGIAADVLGLADVGVLATHTAGGFGLVPFAVDVVPAFAFINNLGALLGATTTVLVPDAPVVVVTRGEVGVTVEATALAEVGVVGLSGAHVLAVAAGVDGGLSRGGVLLRVVAGARLHANLVLGVIHAVEVGVAGGGSGLSVSVTALHAAEDLELAVDLGQGDHGLEFATVVGVGSAEGGVVRVAGAEALVEVGVVLAHAVSVAVALIVDHLAAALALADGGIPHAFGVTIAVVLVGPAPDAVLGADGGTGAPDAHTLSFAGSDGVERPAILLAGGVGGVPHAAAVGVARGLVGVLDLAGRQARASVPGAELVGCAVGSDVVESGVGDLLITTAEVAALVGLRSPLALRISGTGGGGVVAEDALHVAGVEVPLTEGVGIAERLGEELVAEGGALKSFVVPHAVVIVGATEFVAGVFVDALSAAVVDGPLALAGVASASRSSAEAVAGLEATRAVPEAGVVSHARRRGAVAVLALAGANVGNGGGVPFAAVVRVAHGGSPLVVAADAADVALGGVPDAHGVRVAASDIGFFTAATAAAVLVEVPHAARELAAAVGVVGEELAVHLADVVLPVAHSGLDGAGSLIDDFSASGLALAAGGVPHALLVGDAASGVLGEGVACVALVIADAVSGVPVARRIGVAARLIAFRGVLAALITAAAESGLPGAGRILGAVGFGAVAVLALSLAVLRLDVPLAES